MVFMYQTLSVVATQFSHANINMPKWLDDLLMIILVTPNMHRVHHHYRRPYTDSNYSNIFSIWDRLFGTLMLADNRKLVYGIDSHMDEDSAWDIVTMLKIPFQKYKTPPTYSSEEKL